MTRVEFEKKREEIFKMIEELSEADPTVLAVGMIGMPAPTTCLAEFAEVDEFSGDPNIIVNGNTLDVVVILKITIQMLEKRLLSFRYRISPSEIGELQNDNST